MKKEKNYNKIVSTLNYVSAVCFYVVSISNFISRDNSKGFVFLLLGTLFLCLGTVWLTKGNDKK